MRASFSKRTRNSHVRHRSIINPPFSKKLTPSDLRIKNLTQRSIKKADFLRLQPYSLFGEVRDGSFWLKCQQTTLKPPWALREIIKVCMYGLPLAITLICIQIAQLTLIPRWIYSTDGSLFSLSSQRIGAIGHLGQECVLLCSSMILLWASLKESKPRSKGFFTYRISAKWTTTTILLCALLFPFVDPLLYSQWSLISQSLSQEVNCWLMLTNQDAPACSFMADIHPSTSTASPGLGAMFVTIPPVPATVLDGVHIAPGLTYKETVVDCVQHGDYQSLGMHFMASCLIGPFWEETLWRGFLLPSAASRLSGQFPVVIAASSTMFAALHLNLAAGLPIFFLSCACDILYLRSGSVGPALLLHAAWNAYQFLGVALFGKSAFV
ncbi:hypothetical protein CEUSTIGMA_g409.t1 [Chlamydomonas eustigma]|uniref:CAAX prenyl protease 2/Lysostaphin resistance protein A-like domain-containing protein n=1 Tax=Chlamydomonas eustigma TaxID=1157962 RepID=A0A250WQ23_9CHLO|nr:hypothetical protein CEUSTIGMA_g409.t1 [Chlamydomonas eustigma]|eukprot:GAX72954.1 hypothetical protein CEUSTIGMA_g409.t1 [Chlamydomonas eustigma]